MQQRTNSGIFKCCSDRHVKALELTTGWTVRRLAIGTIVKFQLLGLRHKQSQDPEEGFMDLKTRMKCTGAQGLPQAACCCLMTGVFEAEVTNMPFTVTRSYASRLA